MCYDNFHPLELKRKQYGLSVFFLELVREFSLDALKTYNSSTKKSANSGPNPSVGHFFINNPEQTSYSKCRIMNLVDSDSHSSVINSPPLQLYSQYKTNNRLRRWFSFDLRARSSKRPLTSLSMKKCIVISTVLSEYAEWKKIL